LLSGLSETGDDPGTRNAVGALDRVHPEASLAARNSVEETEAEYTGDEAIARIKKLENELAIARKAAEEGAVAKKQLRQMVASSLASSSVTPGVGRAACHPCEPCPVTSQSDLTCIKCLISYNLILLPFVLSLTLPQPYSSRV
jgi:hypothetical protein